MIDAMNAIITPQMAVTLRMCILSRERAVYKLYREIPDIWGKEQRYLVELAQALGLGIVLSNPDAPPPENVR